MRQKCIAFAHGGLNPDALAYYV